MHLKNQQGISLIAAIFLLVVTAALLTYILSLSAVQRDTSVLNAIAARAIQAARRGIEEAAFDVLENGIPCTDVNGSSFNTNAGGNTIFTVNLSCTSSIHIENSTTIEIFNLTSTATYGTYGNLDYTARTISATVSQTPP